MVPFETLTSIRDHPFFLHLQRNQIRQMRGSRIPISIRTISAHSHPSSPTYATDISNSSSITNT